LHGLDEWLKAVLTHGTANDLACFRNEEVKTVHRLSALFVVG
jgi:hypothetical protein